MARGLILLVAGLAACGAEGDRPGYVVLPGMHEAVAYEAYSAHPSLGQTLRLPPEGTLPYGSRRLAYGPGAEEAERAGRELASPLAGRELPKEELAAGKRAYDIYCQVCHGVAGAGDGPIIGRFPNPPSLLAERAKGLPDGRLFHVITHGQGLMSSYAVQLPEKERWRVIAYVRWLQQLAPGATAASAEKGAVK